MILVAGTVALDDVKTPFESKKNLLGGSGVYFSIAANILTKVGISAIVGNDYPEEYLKKLSSKEIQISGIQQTEGSSFHWTGRYEQEMNTAYTEHTELGVLLNFKPQLPSLYQDAPYLFLANLDPDIQMQIYQQVKSTTLVGMDSMNFWIESKPKELWQMLKKVDILFLNDAEVRQLTGESSLIKATKDLLKKGPKTLIVKKGEHGVLAINQDFMFTCPSYPTETVKDPTGAGDSFAGGVMSYLAHKNSTKDMKVDHLKEAIVWGSALASFTVESLSTTSLEKATVQDVKERCHKIHFITQFLKHQ